VRGRCERYLRLALFPSEGAALMHRYGVRPEALSPLLAEAGSVFEHAAVCRCRRGVEAYHASLQVVDAQHGLIEFAFKRAPTRSDAQIVEDRRQPIIGQVVRCDFASDAPTKCNGSIS
jgi:hypothetical protein